MANGYFERGEVYWVRVDTGMGTEMGVGRPALIISNNRANNSCPSVIMAWMTTQRQEGQWDIHTEATGKRSWILVNQITTVDKSRLGKMIGVLPFEDMRMVDDALEDRFDLGYNDSPALAEKDKEIEELKVKIAELTGEVAREQAKYIELEAKHEDELLSYKVENSMWQKCYDKVLTQLVDMKCMNDLFVRSHLSAEPKLPEVPDLPRKPVEPAKVIDPEEPVLNVPVKPVKVVVTETRVDINHCTQTQLKKIGMSDALARAVVAKRPFNSVADLKNVPGMTKKKYQIFEPKVCCTPLEIIVLDKEPVVPEAEVVTEPVTETEGKLNINYVLAKELHEVTGVSLTQCYEITGYRTKNGAFKDWDDLRKAPHVSNGVVAKLEGKIEFGPLGDAPKPRRGCTRLKEPVEPYEGEKVNINTASAKEIHDITGLDMTVCYSITGCRKRDGLYRDVEDVRNIPRFTDYHWAKYGQMFEV